MSCSYLGAGGQVVVDSEGDFGLLSSDHAVGQGEVDEKGLEGAQLRPLGQAHPRVFGQANGLGHPGRDGIRNVQSQLGFPSLRTVRDAWS